MKNPNLQLVLKADQELFCRHNLKSLEQYFSKDYIEHSPLVKDALPGLKSLVEEAGDALFHKVTRAWMDGEYVALHGSYTGLADETYVGFDIYRVQNNLLAEHWDGLVLEQPPNASGRTQLDGETKVDRNVDTGQSRALVLKFFQDVLIKGNYQNIDEYTNGDAFIQHSPDIADGSTPMREFLEKLRDDKTPLIYHKIHRTVAQGQFVLTHSEGEFNGERTSYFELWRVKNGKIVELWDAISSVPSDEEALHDYGIF